MEKHWKDTDYSGIIAKIRVLEKHLLSRQALEKMCESRNMAEIYKTLADANWHFAYEEKEPARVLAGQQEWMFDFLRQAAPEKNFLYVLLRKTDYQNIKAYVKQELAGNPIHNDLFLQGGTIPISALVKSLAGREKGALSERMFSAFLRARNEFLEKQNPQRIDLILDAACTEEILQCTEAFENAFILQYLRMQIDAVNLKTLLRVRKMNEGLPSFREVFLKGGSIPEDRLKAQLDSTVEDCKAFLLRTEIGEKLSAPLEDFFQDGSVMPLEKGLDELLIEQLRKVRFTMFGPEPIFVYAKNMENEIRSVRIVMNGILSGLHPQSIKERLRLSYA